MVEHFKNGSNSGKYFQFFVLVLLGLIVIFIAYYFLYALPLSNSQKNELEKAKIDIQLREIALKELVEQREENEARKNTERVEEQKAEISKCRQDLGNYILSFEEKAGCAGEKTCKISDEDKGFVIFFNEECKKLEQKYNL